MWCKVAPERRTPSTDTIADIKAGHEVTTCQPQWHLHKEVAQLSLMAPMPLGCPGSLPKLSTMGMLSSPGREPHTNLSFPWLFNVHHTCLAALGYLDTWVMAPFIRRVDTFNPKISHWSPSLGAGTEKRTIERQPRISCKCLHPGFLFNKLKRKPRIPFWMHHAAANFIFALPLLTKLRISDPCCLVEMTGRERGVESHDNTDTMEQRAVLSGKFHLSLWQEGRRGMLLHKQRMCLFSLHASTLYASGERKLNVFPKFGLHQTHTSRNVHTDVGWHTPRYSFGNCLVY